MSDGKKALTIKFFYSSSCDQCHEKLAFIQDRIAARYRDRVDLQVFDIDHGNALQELFTLEDTFRINDLSVMKLFFPSSYLLDKDIIRHFDEELRKYLVLYPAERTDIVPGDRPNFNCNDYWSRIGGVAVLLTAGLVDGINPCAFGVMVFLFSLIICLKKKKEEIFAIGLIFSLAVFITYFLLGLGVLKVLKALAVLKLLYYAINACFIVALLILGTLSLIDAFKYKKYGDADHVILKLPDFLKSKAIDKIHQQMHQKIFFPGIFGLGVIVTLFESVCTGQLYLPTILFIIKNEVLNMKAWLYLLLYNIVFVIPLLLITIIAYFGLRSNILLGFYKRNVFVSKVLVATIFLGLAIILTYLFN